MTRIGPVSEDVRHPTAVLSRAKQSGLQNFELSAFPRRHMPAHIAAWRSRLLAVALLILASSAWAQQRIKVGWLSSLATGRV